MNQTPETLRRFLDGETSDQKAEQAQASAAFYWRERQQAAAAAARLESFTKLVIVLTIAAVIIGAIFHLYQ